ncbi:MAG TPA: NUDIX domain-containing protein [Candidatus Woesebacteria bacterium]|nr:NUDIX domain-containing protein [Candidatus Woesebacteria bacterium]
MALPKYSVLQIRPAKDSLTGQAAFIEFLASIKSSLKSSFMDRLLNNFETITLEIANLNQTTYFVIACPERLEHLVRSQIAAQYPTALINPMKDYLSDWVNHGQPQFGQLVLTAPSELPLNVTEDEKVDQMTAILGSLSRVSTGQAAVIQIALFAAPGNWQKSLRKSLEPKPVPEGGKASPNPAKTFIEKKLAHQAYGCDIRLVAISQNESTSNQLLSQLAAAFGTYSLSEGNSFKLKSIKPASYEKLRNVIIDRSTQYSNQYQFLNYAEIAAIYHLPGASLANIKGIAWGKTLRGEPPANLPISEDMSEEEKQEVNFFAKTEYKNRLVSFGMKKGEDRRRHVYVLGKSGTGKSTLLANMAINDIRHGEGMALVDPHGDTAEHLLDYIPSNRIQDVAYLDPSVVGKSFHLNPLFVKNQAYAELVASGIVSIFSKLYGNSWGPRLEYILRNTLLTLVAKPGATLLDVPRILTNKVYREEYLAAVQDPVLHNFWHDEYDKYSEKFQSEAISPILNKVGQFITSPTIRDIISHPDSTVDFEDLMNNGKIIILNLPQGKIGEDNAALLGAMFISQIQIAAMNRANMAEKERKDFFLYVDEFQNFATTSFIKILSEARKYRLNLILANQYTAQLPIEIQDAIFGNAGTLISFVVGAADANRLMNELGNFYTQDDLVGLARYQIIVKISVNASISNPFSATTLPLPETKDNNRQRIIEMSEEQFYRKTEALDMSQATIYTPSAPAPKREYRPAYPNQSGPRGEDRSYSQSTPYRPQQQSPKPFSSPSPVVARNEMTKRPQTNSSIEPSLEDLDKDRAEGLRPSVVGCFINSGKILFTFQKVHQLWQLPQGGVDNGEDLVKAFKREMTEELGEDFVKQTSFKPTLVAVDKIEFPPDKQGLRELNLDSGESVTMKGKKYYFLYATSASSSLKFPSDEEYSDFRWLNFPEAIELAKTSAQGGKLRITTSVLEVLKTKGFLSSEPSINNQKEKAHESRPQHHPRSESGPVIRPPRPTPKPRAVEPANHPNIQPAPKLAEHPNSQPLVIGDNLPATVSEPGTDLLSPTT